MGIRFSYDDIRMMTAPPAQPTATRTGYLAALVEGFVEWCARSSPDALLQALADPSLASVRGRHVPVPGF